MELTIQEAAEHLNVSERFVEYLISQDKLKAQSVGGQIRIGQNDLIEYIQARDKRRDEALTELVRQSEELGLYD